MSKTTNVKTLRHEMKRVGAGAPQDDTLYKAGPVGRSTNGLTSADHDRVLYGDADEQGGAFHRQG